MSRPRGPRRKYAPRLPREQRREQLLDAAMTVLDGCQLQELSMEAVAEAAGVGKPVLYTVFRTRGELVAALLRREHQSGIEQVRTAMPDDLTVRGPTGAYAATVSAFLQVVLENPTRWRLILTMPDSAPREIPRCAAAVQVVDPGAGRAAREGGNRTDAGADGTRSGTARAHHVVIRRDAGTVGGQRSRHLSARASRGLRPHLDGDAERSLLVIPRNTGCA